MLPFLCVLFPIKFEVYDGEVNTVERVKNMEGLVTLLVLYYLFGFYYIFTAIIGHYLKTGRVTFDLGGQSILLSYLITSTVWIYIAIKNYKRPF